MKHGKILNSHCKHDRRFAILTYWLHIFSTSRKCSESPSGLDQITVQTRAMHDCVSAHWNHTRGWGTKAGTKCEPDCCRHGCCTTTDVFWNKEPKIQNSFLDDIALLLGCLWTAEVHSIVPHTNMKPRALATWLILAANKQTKNNNPETLGITEKFVELHFELGNTDFYRFTSFSLVHCRVAAAQIPWIHQAESQLAPRNNNQREPSHFTRLTSSPEEEDVTRRQRRRVASETYLEFERLHVVGAGGEVGVDPGAAAERPVVRVLLQPHAVPLAVAAVQALPVATCCPRATGWVTPALTRRNHHFKVYAVHV